MRTDSYPKYSIVKENSMIQFSKKDLLVLQSKLTQIKTIKKAF